MAQEKTTKPTPSPAMALLTRLFWMGFGYIGLVTLAASVWKARKVLRQLREAENRRDSSA